MWLHALSVADPNIHHPHRLCTQQPCKLHELKEPQTVRAPVAPVCIRVARARPNGPYRLFPSEHRPGEGGGAKRCARRCAKKPACYNPHTLGRLDAERSSEGVTTMPCHAMAGGACLSTQKSKDCWPAPYRPYMQTGGTWVQYVREGGGGTVRGASCGVG